LIVTYFQQLNRGDLKNPSHL